MLDENCLMSWLHVTRVVKEEEENLGQLADGVSNGFPYYFSSFIMPLISLVSL